MSSLKFLTVFNPSAGASFTVTMPPSGSLMDGEAHRFSYIGPYAASYPITFVPNSGQTFQNGSVASLPLSGSNASLELVWSATLNSWLISVFT